MWDFEFISNHYYNYNHCCFLFCWCWSVTALCMCVVYLALDIIHENFRKYYFVRHASCTGSAVVQLRDTLVKNPSTTFWLVLHITVLCLIRIHSFFWGLISMVYSIPNQCCGKNVFYLVQREWPYFLQSNTLEKMRFCWHFPQPPENSSGEK